MLVWATCLFRTVIPARATNPASGAENLGVNLVDPTFQDVLWLMMIREYAEILSHILNRPASGFGLLANGTEALEAVSRNVLTS